MRTEQRGGGGRDAEAEASTPNLPTNIVDFGGFDSSIILILRGGILMSIGDFPESLSQAMLVGTMYLGRLGVREYLSTGYGLRFSTEAGPTAPVPRDCTGAYAGNNNNNKNNIITILLIMIIMISIIIIIMMCVYYYRHY